MSSENDINNSPNEEPKDKVQPEGEPSVLSPIGEMELEACRLKFEGYSWKEMREKMVILYGERAPAERTMKNWFWKGGRIYLFYKDFARQEANVRRSESTDIFRAHLKDAVRQLVTLMKTSSLDMVKLMAAKEIINREMGEPLKVVSDAGKDPATRILEELGITDKDDGESDKSDV